MDATRGGARGRALRPERLSSFAMAARGRSANARRRCRDASLAGGLRSGSHARAGRTSRSWYEQARRVRPLAGRIAHPGSPVPAHAGRPDARERSTLARRRTRNMIAKRPPLRPDREYLRAFATIMSRIEKALGPKRPAQPVVACVAGGAALHFYT